MSEVHIIAPWGQTAIFHPPRNARYVQPLVDLTDQTCRLLVRKRPEGNGVILTPTRYEPTPVPPTEA